MRALLLLALLTAAPSHVVRFSWSPAAETDVAEYVVERASEAGWVEVARIPAVPDAPEFNPATGTFTFTSPAAPDVGRWRLTAVDRIGNWSPPVYLAPEPTRPAEPTTIEEVHAAALAAPSCVWRPSPAPWRVDLAVPVVTDKACDCAEVSRRLDSARADVLSVIGNAEGKLLDHALASTTIGIVGPEDLVMPGGQQAAGYADKGRLLLARDLRAAAHELLHVYLTEAGVPAEQQHTDSRFDQVDRTHGKGHYR